MSLETPAGRQEPIIQTVNVQKMYRWADQEIFALRDLNFTVKTGEFVCVIGRSGSGKSSLLNVIGALDKPDHGTVKIKGQDINALNDSALAAFRRRKIGFVFQFFNLMPTLTAVENVALPLLLDGVSSREAMARAQSLLEKFELGQRLEHRPAQLSGGQMQRVAIARALVAKPALLLADEPTGNLDSAIGQQILLILKNLAEQDQQTIVLVTHDVASTRFAHRVVEMGDGAIISDKGA